MICQRGLPARRLIGSQAAVCVMILSDCMSVFRFALFRQIMLCHFADNTGGILTEYRIVLHHANAAAERT